jgi:hypothetical protein
LSKPVKNTRDARIDFFPHLKVPYSDYTPTGCSKVPVDAPVAGYVSGDLAVPILARATRTVSRRVPMPKGTVDEDGHAKRGPREVGSARGFAVMATPATDATLEEGAAEHKLGRGVSALYSGHDPTSLLDGSGVHAGIS